MAEEPRSLEYTPTWVVAVVCSVIVLISLCAERGLHRLGKCLRRKNQNALFEALQKLKEELMLLGFISLLLTVSQGLISHMCIPFHVASYMLPCKLEAVPSSGSHEITIHGHLSHQTMNNGRRLLSEDTLSDHCARKGKVPLLSLEAVHQLHIFIFVLALVHVIFCATTMVLGEAKIRQWKPWEESIRSAIFQSRNGPDTHISSQHTQFFLQRAIIGKYRKLPVVRWMKSFFKQFYGSVTKSDYITLRSGFIQEHCHSIPRFDFHEYMLRTLEYDFKRIVGISWYLWLFVVIFLLMNIGGWHTYFWLSFLPLVLLLLVGAQLEHIISRLARDVVETRRGDIEAALVKPSSEHFWFHRPYIVLHLIHFILFQNSFEIAFFIWIWSTRGFRSCIMEKLVYIIPRLIIGVIVQVLCSYSTLPLYALVTQMGDVFKPGIFNEYVQGLFDIWVEVSRERSAEKRSADTNASRIDGTDHKEEPFGNVNVDEKTRVVDQGTKISIIELASPNQNQMLSP